MSPKIDKDIQPIAIQSDKGGQLLLDRLPYPFVILSKGKCVYCNKPAATLCKVSSAKAMVGKEALDIFHMDFRKVTRERIKEVYAHGSTPEERNLIVANNGTSIMVLMSGTLIDYEGSPSVLLSFKDIEGQHIAKKQLQTAQSTYTQIEDNIQEGIIKFDCERQITYVNKQFCKLVGFTAKELAGKTGQRLLFPTKEAKETMTQVHNKRSKGQSTRYEMQIWTAEKKPVWVSIMGVPFIDDDGNSQGTTELVTDISHTRNRQSALELSEERYRALLDNMNEGVLQVDNEENIEFVNNRFCEMLGYTRDELVGSNANQLFSVSRNASRTMKDKIDERKKGVSSRYELQIKTKKGGVIWVNASGAPFYDADGNVVGSIGINTDITQRKKVEAELESLSRFPSENPMPVLRYSIKNKDFIYHNNSGNSIIRQFNLKKNRTLKKHWENLFKKAYASNMTIQEELQDARVLYMCNVVPVQASGYVNVYMSDITEEKAAEDALLDSEGKFRSLVENMNEGVIRINLDDSIEYVNDSFCQILGYSQKELLGKNRFDVLTVDEGSMRKIEKSVAMRKEGVSSKYELKHERKTGEWIWVSINGTPLYDEKGVMVGSMGIVADITNQKRSEEEIRALNAGLEDRVEERTVELEKANQEIRSLLQEMHHRVKNNLQIVSSLLNLQAASVDDEYVTQVFRESQDRLQTMSFIHESLYLNESMSEISVKDYLDPLVRDRVRVNSDLLSKIELDVQFPDISFNIDTMLPIGLLLNELVTNSLKHAFPNNQEGMITVDLKILPDKSAVLYYSDTGVGFPTDIAGDKSGSIGLILIDSFTMQLDGELKRLDKPGTHYELKFNPM